VTGAIAAAAVLCLMASGKTDWVRGRFTTIGYGDRCPGKYNCTSRFATELVLTFLFLLIVGGIHMERRDRRFAGISVGFALTVIHLVSIPATNTSVNRC